MIDEETGRALATLRREINELQAVIYRYGLSSAGHADTHGIDMHVPRNKSDATAAPTVNDDSGDSYGVGSVWLDVTNDKAYICLDATAGAAVWTEITGGGSSMKLPEIISTFSLYSVGIELAANSASAASSQTWPSANLAIFTPLQLPEDVTAVQAWWHNGGTISGNVDIGIYDTSGNLKRSIGSTAQATANAVQVVNITDIALAAGRYYLALVSSSATATFFMNSLGSVAGWGKKFGLYQQANALPLPDPATFATYATPGALFVPHCGLSLRTTV